MPVGHGPRKTVPGAGGLGKVNVIFKPKRKRNPCLFFLGLILYPIFFSSMFVSYAWTRPYLRYKIILPIFRAVFQSVDDLKSSFAPNQNFIKVNEKGFAIIQKHATGDLLFEQGYAHATDRIFQMDTYRRAAAGRLSEVFASRTLHLDNYARTLNFYKLADQDYSQMSDTSKFYLHRYVDGVNSYIESRPPATLPVDFDLSYGLLNLVFADIRDKQSIYNIEKWTPVHSLAIARLWMYLHSKGWEEDLIAFTTSLLDIEHSTNISSLFHDAPTKYDLHNTKLSRFHTLGSVVMAISADKSSTGHPILLHNFFSKGFWYKNCLYSEELQVCGVSFPGLPLVFHGQNTHVSWAMLADSESDEHLYYPNPRTQQQVDAREEEIIIYDSSASKLLVKSLKNFAKDESPIDIYDLLSYNVKKVLQSHNIYALYLQSPFLVQSVDIVSVLSKVNMAKSVKEIEQIKEHTAGISYRVVYASRQEGIGIHSISKELEEKRVGGFESLMNIPAIYTKTAKFSTTKENHEVILAGPNALLSSLISLLPSHCQYSSLCSSLHSIHNTSLSPLDGEKVLTDTFSPSSIFLSQILKLVLEGDNKIAKRHSKAVPELLQALEGFNGRYGSNSVVASFIEGVRAYLLTHPYSLVRAVGEYKEGGEERESGVNSLYAAVLQSNLTAFKRLSDYSYRTFGLDEILRRGSLSPELISLFSIAASHTLDWLNEVHTTNILSSSPDNVGKDLAGWQWGQVASVLHPHVLEPLSKLQNAVLDRGPDEGAGGLDSVLQQAYSCSVTGSTLLFREDLHAKQHDNKVAFSMVCDLSKSVEYNSISGRYLSSSHAKPYRGILHSLEAIMWASVSQLMDFIIDRKELKSAQDQSTKEL